MKVDYITIRGFRSFNSLERLELRPMNLLIGANGSGKSNFLAVFDLLSAIRRGRLADYTGRKGGAETQLWFGSKNTEEIYLEVSFNNETNGYSIHLAPDSTDRFHVFGEECWFWNRARFPHPYRDHPAGSGLEAGISDPTSRVPAFVQRWLDGFRSYHFHDTSDTSPMKKTGDIQDNALLRPTAANLAAFLHLLQKKYPGSYDLIRSSIRQVTPFFDDFVLVPDRLNEERIMLEWRHTSSDDHFNASSLSDGTLRFMALATLLLQPVSLRPSVIIVDEPELGLHPYAITILASLIRSVSTETQIIMSTQSSLLLDYFEPEDVLVASLASGQTELARLSAELLQEWLSEYSLGQLWEKNQIGGRPQP